MSWRNNQPWLKHGFVPMRGPGSAYERTLAELSYTLSTEKVKWLLGKVAGWDVAINTPIECKISVASKTKGQIVRERNLWNRAEKARWMADPEVYAYIPTKAYVEHPYEKQHTESFIIEGVEDATARGMSTRSIADQLVEIIDARLDCVLLPSDPDNDQAHSVIHSLIGTNKDGMVQKYSQIALVDHDTQAKITSADLQKADDDMKRRVEVAMFNLTGIPWVFPPALGPAPRKLKARVPKAKKIKATPTLQRVTWADFEIALISLGWRIDQPTSSNKRDCGWHGVFKSIRHKAALPSGDFITLEKGKFHLAQMDRADFESAVNTLVQQRMKVVY